DGGGDDVEELVERRQADGGQHRRDLVVGVGDVVGHEWTASLFLATNGSFTTAPASRLPRASTSTGVPTSTSGGRKAKAMPRSRTGDQLPLVTSPADVPSISTG